MLFILKIIVLQVFTLIIFTSGKDHKKPGCGIPDTIALRYPMSLGQYSVWPKRELSYIIRNVTDQLKFSDVQRVFKQAVDKWTRPLSRLYLYETTNLEADIHVFFKSFHDDNFLGCADLPPGGLIYFNQDLKWAISENEKGYNFEWVVVHELGHALGLSHLKNRKYIMFDEYVQNNTAPTEKEITELRTIIKDPARRLKYDTSALCDDSIKIDALHYKDKIHIFLIKNQYWEFNRSLKLVNGPMDYNVNSTVLHFLASQGIDGAIRTFSGRDILFKNNTAYKYNFNNLDYDEENLTSVLGNVPTPIDDVIIIDSNIYYIFKGELVYKFELYCNITKIMKISDEWPGIPYNIDAATVIGDEVLFIIDDRYYISDISTKKVKKTNTLKHFFECPF